MELVDLVVPIAGLDRDRMTIESLLYRRWIDIVSWASCCGFPGTESGYGKSTNEIHFDCGDVLTGRLCCVFGDDDRGLVAGYSGAVE